MRGAKTWHRATKEEIDYIVENWKTVPYPKISMALGITSKAISTIVYNLKKRGLIDGDHWANRSTKKDLTGRRFGSVVAKEYLRTSEEGRAIWLCDCDCGKSAEIGTHNLKRNKSTSCGCVQNARGISRIVKMAYRGHLRNAEDRGYITFLSISEYLQVASNKCVYCDTISIRDNPDTGVEIGLNSVDRIDNEPYYKLENTQAVCFICQRMKSDMKHAEFLRHIEKMARKSPLKTSS